MVPRSAVDLCKRWEGFHRVVQRRPILLAGPYICPAGYWTIGYGTLCDKDHAPITEPEATGLLLDYLHRDVPRVIELCPVLLSEPEDRLGAILSYAYNLGTGRLRASTLRRRVNQRDWPEAARELRRWVWAGGRKLPGLVARREDEAALILEPRSERRAA